MAYQASILDVLVWAANKDGKKFPVKVGWAAPNKSGGFKIQLTPGISISGEEISLSTPRPRNNGGGGGQYQQRQPQQQGNYQQNNNNNEDVPY